MSNAGRKKDPIWICFKEIPAISGKTAGRAICNACGKELRGLVSRMKSHHEKCQLNLISETEEGDEGQSTTSSEIFTIPSNINTNSQLSQEKRKQLSNEPNPKKHCTAGSSGSLSSQCRNISNFFVKTTIKEKESLDLQVARFIYATNSSFRLVEHPEFIKMIKACRPGYTPPGRAEISQRLLDAVHKEELEKCLGFTEDQAVCMSLDGWSNIHNDPIVCTSISTSDGKCILTDTIDTSGYPHNAEYLAEVAAQSIKKFQKDFKGQVCSFVTDNAANVKKMRCELEKNESLELQHRRLITYGCSAHLLNLLSKDVTIKGVTEHIVEIAKYFHNNHAAAALYKASGSRKLVLPNEVRWNTLADCVEVYLSSWPKLVSICEAHRDVIDSVIQAKVINMGIKRNAEDLLKRLKPIAVALDRVQRDRSTIADACETWMTLGKDLKKEKVPQSVIKLFQDRKSQALMPFHFLANIIHPKYQGKNLSDEEREMGMTWCAQEHPDFFPILLKYCAQSAPFFKVLFQENLLDKVSPIEWWLSLKLAGQTENETESILYPIKQVLSAAASTAGLERLFSSFGVIQSNIRNRLGTAKAAKLVFFGESS